MIERFITMQRFAKPIQWVVLMVAAHMMLNVQSQTEVTGILGNGITLKFTFPSEAQVKNNSHIVIHQLVTKVRKVAGYTNGNEDHVFYVHPENNSVSWRIASVTLNDSGRFWASVVNNIATKSNEVQVTIQEVNPTSTVASSLRTSSVPENKAWKPKMKAEIVAIVAVSAVVLMAAVLPFLIWRLFGVKDKQEEQNQQSSNPVVQEMASSVSVSAPSVVYSVLEFPKRVSALSDVIPNDAEYANISYA